ncbi:hypothetical protein [Streptomyces roseifaciens]|uniref:hypothetical protein n=1 Tax=Streptomyces roseifaciens TaxID=1488406 RepID=UPI000A6933AF|nr:hypothetical protein [Streptomyces roseifaciens]
MLVPTLSTASVEQCVAQLRSTGAVRLQGLADRESVARVVPRAMKVQRQRDSGPDGLATVPRLHELGLRVTALSGHGDAELATAGCTLVHPARLKVLACLRAPDQGAAFRLVDGLQLYRAMRRRYPAAAAVFSDPSAAFFGGSGGVRSAVFACGTGGRVALRLRLDALVDWYPAARDHLVELQDVLARVAVVVRLRAGQGLLLDNHRWAVGQEPSAAPYRVVQALGMSHQDLPYGFLPYRALRGGGQA